ncbi:MAG TPA: AMP-binding protein, partial [Opitutales bacterium]|nr:AMP-binding protein [Opitutales bacterium]
MTISKKMREIADATWLPDAAATKFEHFFPSLRKSFAPGKKPVVIAETDPIEFLSLFFGALLSDRPVVLANPDWGKQEWKQALNATGSEWIRANGEIAVPAPISDQLPQINSGEILIPTGGTTGHLRFARHSWKTLSSAAIGFAEHFEVKSIDSLCVLPLFHISGLMQVVRAINTGGTFFPADWKRLERGEIPKIDDGFFLSLVPVQLQRLLRQPDLLPWLRNAKALLIGGAATPAPLVEKAAQLRLPLSLSYGSTETAAMVAAQKP